MCRANVETVSLGASASCSFRLAAPGNENRLPEMSSRFQKPCRKRAGADCVAAGPQAASLRKGSSLARPQKSSEASFLSLYILASFKRCRTVLKGMHRHQHHAFTDAAHDVGRSLCHREDCPGCCTLQLSVAI